MTTFSDDFERPDAETIGNGWVEYTNGFKLRSGAAVPDSTAAAAAMAGTSMATGDHYSEFTVGSTYGGSFVGPIARASLGTDNTTTGTFYALWLTGTTGTAFSVRRKDANANTSTVLGSGTTSTDVRAAGLKMRLRVYDDPDTAGRVRLEGYVNDALVVTGYDDSGLVPAAQRGVGFYAAGGTSTDLRIGAFASGDQAAPAPTGTDTTPPAVPTGLTATTPDYGTVGLTWSAVSDADLARYLLYRSTATPVTTADTLVASLTTPRFTDSGLTGGTTYHYALAAQDTTGNTSALSAEVSATATTAPVTPASDTTKPFLLWNGTALVPVAVPGLTTDTTRADLYGLKAWTMDPILATATSALTSGTFYVSRMPVVAGDVLTNFSTYATAAGSGLTLVRGALYALDGTLLRQTAESSALWTASGVHTHSWQSGGVDTPYTVPAGVGALYIGFIAVGTTAPTLSRAAATGSAPILAFTAASGFRSATLAAQTDVPATLGTPAASNVTLLMASA